MRDKENLKAMRVIYILITVNVLIYLYTCYLSSSLSPNIRVLYNFGAFYKKAILNGEVHRLFTSMFLHAGVSHIFFNMYGLNVLGNDLIKLLGEKKFLALYIFTGVLANIFTLFFNDNNVGVGASGALFGLVGFLLAILFIGRKVFGNEPLKNIVILIVLNFVIILIPDSRIGYLAHIGGLLSGIIFGIIYAKKKFKFR